ncbi:hypothetical protein [Sphingomonas sp. SRS2]|uniref:hypothetical protein n=1 Tax=Sphingomonas sp. SRS2 TaxID=133190 RepID=UPI00061846CB|nr:hypothetical protein [Sphingomonas sp. SRS2]KKC24550.1 hypothetical protein WP12_18850 [Sphingomonas sp. SRS2]
MRKIFKGLAVALAFTSVVAASVPAEARRGDDRHGYRGDHRGWDGNRGWRGDRHDRGYRYDRGYRGYYGGRGYYSPRRYYYAPRYGYGYGYGYGHPRYRYHGHRHGDDALIAGIAGLAIGAAIASSNDY